jgi:hypothetical protein
MPKKSAKKTTKKRTSKSKPEPPLDPTGRAQCAFPGCTEVEFVPGTQYCLAHKAVSGLTTFAEKAQKRGDVLASLAYGFLARGAEAAGPMIQQQARVEMQKTAMQGAAQYAQWRQQQAQRRAAGAAQAQAAARMEPFTILGLNPKTATSKDVRAMQKHFAAVFHTDKAGAGVDAGAMTRINEAAAECLRVLKKAGR